MTPRRALLPAVAVFVPVLVAAALIDMRAAAAAWLYLFILSLGLSAGAISLLLTGRLTDGAWFDALEPVLLPMARAVPLVGLCFVPLMVAAPLILPWADGGARDELVAAFYLDWPLAILRAVVAVAGWSAIAWLVVGRPRGTAQVASAIALIFHVVMVTFLSYDWVMALQPGFTSTAFGAHTAVIFLLSALCAAVLVSPPAAGKPCGDIAGLVMAGILGSVYMAFMQFLIVWYGDLGETTIFYLDRAGIAGVATVIAALVFGGLAPMVLLLPEAGRRHPARLRMAAALTLAGIGLYWGWVVLGLFGPAAIVAGTLSLVATVVAGAVGARIRLADTPIAEGP